MTDQSISVRTPIREPDYPAIEFEITEAALEELRRRYSNPDATTEDGYALCKAGIRELTSLRTDLEAARKRKKKRALDYGRDLDAEARRLTGELRRIEDPVREAKEVIDSAERERAREAAEREQARVAGIRTRIEDMDSCLAAARDAGTDELSLVIKSLEHLTIDEESFAEFTEEAVKTRDAVLYKLHAWHEQAEKREAEDARRREEDERLRREREQFEAEKAEQAEKDRVDRAEREGRQRAQADIDRLRDLPVQALDKSADEIERLIGRARESAAQQYAYADLQAEAERVCERSLVALQSMLESRRVIEAAAAERREQEAERERLAERERIRAEQEAEQARAAEAERVAAAAAEARKPEIQRAREWLARVQDVLNDEPAKIEDDKVFRIVGRVREQIGGNIQSADSALDKLQAKRGEKETTHA